MLSSGHHTAISNMISQQLGLSALVLHKAGPVNSKSQTEGGLTGGCTPSSLVNLGQLKDSGIGIH